MKTFIALACTLSLTVAAVAAKPESITVKGTDAPSHIAPIAVTVSGHTGFKDYTAVAADGREYPLTVNGEDGILIAPAPKTDTTYEIKRAGKSKVQLNANNRARQIDVLLNGDLFTTFHYGDEQVKPYLWPLLAHGDAPITRDWPMGDRNKSKDHPHHESFWTAYGDINGADFWAFTPKKKGTQKVTGWDHVTGAAYGLLSLELTWYNLDGEPVIDELREYRFYNTPSEARLFDVSTTVTATHGDALFGDTKEGGMVSLRMNDDLREKGGSGTITNSEGGVGAPQTWGKPAAWCDYSGTLEGFGKVGVTIMDHPSSFRYPTHWHVRDYGLVGANAFGYSYFYGNDSGKNGDHLLKAGESISFNYRIYVHTGDVEESGVADQYKLFTNPASGSAR